MSALTDLADRLSAVAPMPGPHKFFYGNSGAEAIECALKLARYHTGRQQVISFFGAFHGRTMGALSLTGSKPQQKRRFSPLVPGVTHIPLSLYLSRLHRRTGGAGSLQHGLRALHRREAVQDDPRAGRSCRHLYRADSGRRRLRGSAAQFLRELRAICNRHGILLVADEVQSGAGRTGKWWAIEHSGVEPDMVCMAKGIAVGMPLGICMTKAEIMDWVPGSHASTFGGNPVSLAAALATMDVLEARRH
jgi:4-aminobutyrate aminotransferase